MVVRSMSVRKDAIVEYEVINVAIDDSEAQVVAGIGQKCAAALLGSGINTHSAITGNPDGTAFRCAPLVPDRSAAIVVKDRRFFRFQRRSHGSIFDSIRPVGEPDAVG